MKEVKIKKFQPDRKYYLQGRVYSWMYEKKKVTWANSVEQHLDLETSVPDSSDLSGDEGPSSRNLRQRTIQEQRDREDRDFFFANESTTEGDARYNYQFNVQKTY